jgi:hypothetical protein
MSFWNIDLDDWIRRRHFDESISAYALRTRRLQEKYPEVGKRTSEDIDSFLLEGSSKLKVQRFGSGTDTRYHILAA